MPAWRPLHQLLSSAPTCTKSLASSGGIELNSPLLITACSHHVPFFCVSKQTGAGGEIKPVSTAAKNYVSSHTHCFYLQRLNRHFLLFVHSPRLLKLPICLDTVLVTQQLATTAWSTTLTEPTSRGATSSRERPETTPLPCQSRWAVKNMFHCSVFFSR